MEKWEIIDDIEEIQEQVDEMGFVGSNEKELWTRDLIADYIVKKLNIPIVSNWLACKDELPEHGEPVLTYTPLTEMASEQVRLMKYGTLKSGFPAGITHWQRIDKPTCY